MVVLSLLYSVVLQYEKIKELIIYHTKLMDNVVTRVCTSPYWSKALALLVSSALMGQLSSGGSSSPAELIVHVHRSGRCPWILTQLTSSSGRGSSHWDRCQQQTQLLLAGGAGIIIHSWWHPDLRWSLEDDDLHIAIYRQQSPTWASDTGQKVNYRVHCNTVLQTQQHIEKLLLF